MDPYPFLDSRIKWRFVLKGLACWGGAFVAETIGFLLFGNTRSDIVACLVFVPPLILVFMGVGNFMKAILKP